MWNGHFDHSERIVSGPCYCALAFLGDFPEEIGGSAGEYM